MEFKQTSKISIRSQKKRMTYAFCPFAGERQDFFRSIRPFAQARMSFSCILWMLCANITQAIIPPLRSSQLQKTSWRRLKKEFNYRHSSQKWASPGRAAVEI
jgi:hypothetical protein